MRLKNWIRRSFRNRTFATILIATLLPLLLCDVVMMQVIVARTEHTQTRQGRDALDTLTARFTDTAALCGDTAETLAVSTITRSALRRTGEDSRLLYQFLYRQAAQLRPYADAAIYDAGGVCLYTTDAALPAAPLDTDWGALYAARRSDGTVFLSSNKGLLAARAVTGYGGQLLGYVTVRMESSGFAGCLTASWLPPDDLLVLDSTWRTVYYTRTVQAGGTVASLRSQLLAGQKLTGDEGDDCMFYTAEGPGGFTLLLQQPRIYTGAGAALPVSGRRRAGPSVSDAVRRGRVVAQPLPVPTGQRAGRCHAAGGAGRLRCPAVSGQPRRAGPAGRQL